MANAQETYDAIKNLETNNVLSLTKEPETILAGTFEPGTGGFQFAVPTMLITEPVQPDDPDRNPLPPGGGTHGTGTGHHPQQPVQYPAGVVTTNSADLKLEFQLAGAPLSYDFSFRVGLFPWATIVAGQTSAIVDVGSWTSTAGDQPSTLTVSWPTATHTATIHLVVKRPPTFGAFTIPVVPLAIVYAPPPGTQNKNYAEYTSTSASSTKISTTVGSDTTTTQKTATAYTTNDFIGKITQLLDSISTFGTSLPDDQSSATILDIKSWTSGLDLASQLLQAFVPDETSSDSTAVTTTDDHDLLTTDTSAITFGTPAGLGPGAGDRFIYLRNVRAAWLISDGLLDFTVLGHDGIRAFSGEQLLDDARAMGPTVLGGVMAPPEVETPAVLGAAKIVHPFPTVGPTTNLDGGSLRMLLHLDPFAMSQSPVLAGPRFIPNDDPTTGGSGTDPGGDVLNVSHQVTSTDTTTSTTVNLHISDYKPGWLVALFGGNQSQESQLSGTFTQGKVTSQDETVSANVHIFAGPNDPPYLFGVYYDRLFRTLAFTPAPADQLRVGAVVNVPVHKVRGG